MYFVLDISNSSSSLPERSHQDLDINLLDPTLTPMYHTLILASRKPRAKCTRACSHEAFKIIFV